MTTSHTVQFTASPETGPASGYLMRPATGRPGLIVLQEWWGLVPHIKDLVGILPEAEVELVARADPSVRRKVAGYYMSDGLYPAALAAWRSLLVSGTADGDEGLVKEARAMIRALVLFAKPLDPAAYPTSTSRSRVWLGVIARRGG